jgi:SulP family sulfate permease
MTESHPDQNSARDTRRRLSFERLLSSLGAASVLAVMNVAAALSMGALVFAGPLADKTATGVGLFLIATALAGLLVPLASGYRGMIASPRSGQAPIFAAMAAAIVAAMPGALPEQVAATVVAAILAATVVTGLVMYGLGRRRLGTLVRYLPYPVISGFFAGLGYLLIAGGVTVALGAAGATAPQGAAALLRQVAPALVFALGLFVLERRVRHGLLMPLYVCAAILVHHVATAGAPVAAPLTAPESGAFWPPITPDGLALVDWSMVLAQADTIAVLALLSVIMLLLDVAGLEIVIGRDLDPNRELRAAGLANIFGGLAGSALAFSSAAGTTLAHRLGGGSFATVVIYVALVLGTLLLGPSALTLVPAAVLGGLLVYTGLTFLERWLWQAWRRLPVADFLVVAVILAVVARFGILEGVAAGIVLAALIFVHSYSRIGNVRVVLRGDEHNSNVDRAPQEQAHLDSHADRLLIYLLQGFLFFGSANRLLDGIRAQLAAPEAERLRFLLLDFRGVSGMDTSAGQCFGRLMQKARETRRKLVFTGCTPRVRARLERLRDELGIGAGNVRFFGELAEGRAWCDDMLLEGLDGNNSGAEVDVTAALTRILGDAKAAALLSAYFTEQWTRAGADLFAKGEKGDALFLILEGAVAIRLPLPDGGALTLRTIRAGAVVGGMALYSGEPRSATCTVVKDARLARLDLEAYRRMERDHPAVAGQFHKFIVRLMAERVVRTNRELMAQARPSRD